MIIHAYIWNPKNGIFKASKNERAECTIINCEIPDKCTVHKSGACLLITSGLVSTNCPHGKKTKTFGFTGRARKFHSWIADKKKLYRDTPSLSSPVAVIGEVGDYIFLPYSFMSMNKSIPFISSGGFFSNGVPLVKSSQFTVKNIINICEFRPQAMMGGEIKNYQKESVPKFLIHLYEKFPELFGELASEYQRAVAIIKDYSYIGRKAILETVIPNKGQLVDIHGSSWVWDGTHLTSINSSASFMIVGKFSELRVTPVPGQKIKITSNDQVGNDTILVD